jgi:hypothetical protein
MQKQQGRKALVLLTDGVDTGSKETLDAAIESAQKANTVVYTILFKDDEGWPAGVITIQVLDSPAAVGPEAGQLGVNDIPASALTERKSSVEFLKRPVDAFLS